MAWTLLGHLILKTDVSNNILANPFEPYTIYGAGTVLAILLVKPLAQKFKHKLVATFGIATLACALLEYFSSVILVARYGYNPYWNYSDKIFNLSGHICLENALAFGILATLFLRFIYPLMEKILKKGNQIIINLFLLVLVIICAIYYLSS
jgi:uncharacterized membrane protein